MENCRFVQETARQNGVFFWLKNKPIKKHLAHITLWPFTLDRANKFFFCFSKTRSDPFEEPRHLVRANMIRRRSQGKQTDPPWLSIQHQEFVTQSRKLQKKKRFYTSIASELNYRIRGKILQFLFFFLSRWVLERGILYDARMHGFSLSSKYKRIVRRQLYNIVRRQWEEDGKKSGRYCTNWNIIGITSMGRILRVGNGGLWDEGSFNPMKNPEIKSPTRPGAVPQKKLLN